MTKLVKLNDKVIPSDVLDWILNYFWTGKEEEDDFKSLFDWTSRDDTVTQQWETICSLSRTSRLLRNLSLPRMTGTLYFVYFKTIGKFWKAVQLNPLLGSFTHTCYFKLYSSVCPFPLTPSLGLEQSFKEDAAEKALAEAMRENPNDIPLIEQIRDWRRTGPDGIKSDRIISDPEELREALIGISKSWIRIRSLSWDTESLPLFTGIIEHVQSLGTLDSLSVSVAACEERYFLPPSNPSTQQSTLCTPLWKLSQKVSHLTIETFGLSHQGFGNPDELDESILNPQIDLLSEALQKAAQVKVLSLRNWCYPSKSHDQSRFKRFLKEILPRMACIPKIEIPYPIYCFLNHFYYSMQQLHPQVETLSMRKHLLEASDIRRLGRKASEEKDHPLACLSHLLEDDEVAERIVKEWNEKYAPL